ncbi:hypothetical protein Rsub_05230 [Raphidocelis subcapitata]|uniref:3'-5' exonuclease domain-containing protein n=1 Tax=Raphidocelis subcapitata TaxID=307507 RepID=A0A2V0NYC6_9CHLO|nr:hypothetical protein Rsub_05230 [Raphidocelis subcapitata]|eukprot:GBF92616.1 hypothetical protein Rsub_05230 [Raphidocelis subcapitata]
MANLDRLLRMPAWGRVVHPALQEGARWHAKPMRQPRGRARAASPRAAASAAGAAAAEAAAARQLEPLTNADLSAHIQAHGLQAAILPRPPDLDDADVIKSLVFSANSQPVLVVAPLAAKVNERKLAAHLGVSRRRVRLASTDDALAHSGYAVGTVPPFGHRHPLRTLVDAAVTRHPGPWLWAGGGHPDLELRVSVTELLAHTAPEVGDFAGPASGAAASDGSSLESGDEGEGALPQPWPAGSDVVRLVGIVALRRRIAKTLLFLTLVPETTPSLPPNGQAAWLRRVWRHPERAAPAEVQVIVGKTVERALGREGAIALMDSLKVGSVVAVTGRVQPNPGGGGVAPNTLDVVAHSVSPLHKSADALASALRRAARDSGLPVSTAAELERLRRLGAEAYSAAFLALPGASGDSGDEGGGAAARRRARSGGAAAAGPPGGGGASDGSSSSGALAGNASGAGTLSRASTGSGASSAGAPSGSGQAADEEPRYWQLPLPGERVADVSDAASLAAMRETLLGALARSAAARRAAGGADVAPSMVVGLDVEWRPFERGASHTPAALLQVALRDTVFLVDLLALCRRSPLQLGPQPAAGDAATEAALCEVLAAVFCSPDAVKVGFYLAQDLERIRSSYPWLPLFAPGGGSSGGGGGGGSDGGPAPDRRRGEAAAGEQAGGQGTGGGQSGDEQSGGEQSGCALAMHVDLLALVRAALPRMESLAHLSLARLTEQLLGAPLDKGPQRSDWELRPLTQQQRDYAAGDAAVLTVLFDAVQARAAAPLGARALAGLAGGLAALPLSPEEERRYPGEPPAAAAAALEEAAM